MREAGKNLEPELERELELAANLAKYYIRSFSLEPTAAIKTDTKTFKIRRIQKRGPLSGPLSSLWAMALAERDKRWPNSEQAKPSATDLIWDLDSYEQLVHQVNVLFNRLSWGVEQVLLFFVQLKVNNLLHAFSAQYYWQADIDIF